MRGKSMFCNKCGTELKEGQQFCSNCGEKRTKEVKEPKKKRLAIKVIASVCVLAVILCVVFIFTKNSKEQVELDRLQNIRGSFSIAESYYWAKTANSDDIDKAQQKKLAKAHESAEIKFFVDENDSMADAGYELLQSVVDYGMIPDKFKDDLNKKYFFVPQLLDDGTENGIFSIDGSQIQIKLKNKPEFQVKEIRGNIIAGDTEKLNSFEKVKEANPDINEDVLKRIYNMREEYAAWRKDVFKKDKYKNQFVPFTFEEYEAHHKMLKKMSDEKDSEKLKKLYLSHRGFTYVDGLSEDMEERKESYKNYNGHITGLTDVAFKIDKFEDGILYVKDFCKVAEIQY